MKPKVKFIELAIQRYMQHCTEDTEQRQSKQTTKQKHTHHSKLKGCTTRNTPNKC